MVEGGCKGTLCMVYIKMFGTAYGPNINALPKIMERSGLK